MRVSHVAISAVLALATGALLIWPLREVLQVTMQGGSWIGRVGREPTALESEQSAIRVAIPGTENFAATKTPTTPGLGPATRTRVSPTVQKPTTTGPRAIASTQPPARSSRPPPPLQTTQKKPAASTTVSRTTPARPARVMSTAQTTKKHQSAAPTKPPLARKLRVAWDGPFASGLTMGFAQEGLGFLLGLRHRADVALVTTYFEDNFRRKISAEHLSILEGLRNLKSPAAQRPDVYVTQWTPAPGFDERIQSFLHKDVRPQKRDFKVVARLMYETDTIPKVWAKDLPRMDRILVTSAWQLEVFAANGVPRSKLRVLAEVVDGEQVFNPALLPSKEACQQRLVPSVQDRFVFLSVGKKELRKNWDALLRAFFTVCQHREADDLALVVVNGVPAAEVDCLRPRGMTKGKVVALKSLSAVDIVHSYRAADAFVTPTHGEGFGRPIVEAMAMELPTIATNWSGPAAFLGEAWSYPLPIKGLVAADRGNGKWADVAEESVVQLMEHVLAHPEERRAKAKAARAYVLAHFSESVIADQLLNILEEVVRDG